MFVSTAHSQETSEVVEPGNLWLINRDTIPLPWRGDIKSSIQAYQKKYGVFYNDTILIRAVRMKKGEFGVAHHNEIQLNMWECDRLPQYEFKSIVLYLLTTALQPKEASPVFPFQLGREKDQVVVQTHGLRFIFKDGSECVLLQEAMAEAFGAGVDSHYVCIHASRRYIGSLLNELVRKEWVTGTDLAIAIRTNNPGLVIAKIVGSKDGKPSPHDVRVVIGIFSLCYYNADWQSFLPELQFYRDNREALYMLEP